MPIYENFNSHAHVERDKPSLRIELADGISTHTLTWSVTETMTGFMTAKTISTHTLTWSVTMTLPRWQGSSMISTHTLTWSVTLDVVYIWCLLNVMRTYCFI